MRAHCHLPYRIQGNQNDMKSLRLPGLYYWGAWTLAGMYNFSRDVIGSDWHMLLTFNVAHFAIWGLLGIVMMPIMRRYPLRLHPSPWLFHIVAGAIFTQIDITAGHILFDLMRGSTQHFTLMEQAQRAFFNCFHLGFMNYWAFLGVVQGLDMLRQARLREVQLAEQRTALVRAQLESLKLQLQPHFLFNTLHAIGSLMHYDLGTAERMLTRLSEVLRTSLRAHEKPFVTLHQEMTFIEAYVDIEKIRFEQRLRVQWEVPEAMHGLPIPPFILQPLVENAIKYGVAPRADGGTVTIRAYAKGDTLLLEVEDDAPDNTPHQQGFGVGLRNTRSRLETLYGQRQRFELLRAPGGTVARIHIPLHDELAKAA
jgi:two-component system LytT family sensor kinase